MPAPLELFVVYWNPLDYPNRFVVREWLVMLKPDVHDCTTPFEPMAVVGTLEEARAAVPLHCCNVGRYNQDDPAIREVWI